MHRYFRMAATLAVVSGLVVASIGMAAEKPSKEEALMISAQKICPVSGQELKSMGGAVKTTLDDQTMFLCCKGCVGKPGKEAHLATIKENLIKAQGHCAVMKKPLPDDATSIVVEGREIFVCCPPCTKKIKADPEKYTKAVNEMYTKNLNISSKESEKKE